MPVDPELDAVEQTLLYYADRGDQGAAAALKTYRVHKRLVGTAHTLLRCHLELLESRVHPSIHASLTRDLALLEPIS